MERPTVYSKEHCVQCTATTRKLDELGIDYDVIPLETVSHELIEAFRQDNLLSAPIVEANGERWSGFRPDKLGELALGQVQSN
jgi:glutaredoxin-like protein NrdH